MKEGNIALTLASVGWIVGEDEVGDAFAQFMLEDRFIQWIYSLDKIRGEQKLGGMISLSTCRFSEACSRIFGGENFYYPLIRSMKNMDIRAVELTDEHVKEASYLALSWAESQDLNKALYDYALLPTDAPGARPIWHLAALAILGDVEKLQSYRDGFQNGERQGFVPYIDIDHINRALAIANGGALRA